MKKPEFKILVKDNYIPVKDNYLQMIKNSPGTRMFRNFFVIDKKGKKQDVLGGTRRSHSCASFVSNILIMSSFFTYPKIISFITYPHAMVDSTVRDMLKNGWRRTKKLEPGNILLWGKDKDGDRHLGFYIGNKKAISNSLMKGYPVVHHYTFGKIKTNQPKRKIEGIFTHPDIK